MSVPGVRWLELASVRDPRGVLTAAEVGRHVPFAIARAFWVHDVTPGVERGGHAHRDTDQVAVAVHGSLRIELSDGRSHDAVRLDDPARGLFIPRMTFTRLVDFSPGAVCLVLADTLYDASRSLRSWEAFLAALPAEGP